MSQIVILSVEDEPEVRAAVLRDLESFGDLFRIEEAEDVIDAREVMAECLEDNDPIGLILCDHILPGENGVDFLIDLNSNPDTASIRKVLITGQAGQEDTIRAVNQADIHHYIAKPWNAEELYDVAKKQLTEFVLGREEDLIPYVAILDGPRLMEAMSHRKPGW